MAFPFDDNEPRRNPAEIRLGEDLSAWSVSDLEKRILALEAEISRTREDIAAKIKHKSEADRLFGPS